jgi:hypothetical protein
MTSIYFDHLDSTDDVRRQSIFKGNILVTSPLPSVTRLCRHAQTMIDEAFSQADPRLAQFKLAVEEFVNIIGPLKSRFTNDHRTKSLVQDVLSEFGCDLNSSYFDVPRLRIVTHGGYLTAGVGYAYRPHRDIWYASPTSQINWWMPVYRLEADQALAFYPAYWNRSISNSSNEFDYDEWCRVGRQQAATQIDVDTRKHPLPQEQISQDTELRLVCEAASTICFSSAHLHATSANTSGMTRFSLDFRTWHRDDLRSSKGAPNIDSAAKGSTLRDFIRASDFSPFSEETIRQHLSVK